MYQELIDKKAKLAVIGLGYVGLPIALEFAKKLSVIGFDIKPTTILNGCGFHENEPEKKTQ